MAGVTVRTIQRAIRAGDLANVSPGKWSRIPRNDALRFVGLKTGDAQ
jgi:hypothetical protein